MDSSPVLPLGGRSPSSPQCQWGGAYTQDWGAKERRDWGRKPSWASSPNWVWVPRAPKRALAAQLLGVQVPSVPPGLTHLPGSTCCWDRLISAHHFGVTEGGPPTPPSLSFVVPARRSSFISPFPAFGKQLGNV